MIAKEVMNRLPELRERFRTAKPFKHICVDEFFEPAAAEALLRDFPSFDPRKAVNEFGEVGGKASVPTLREISPFYAEVYRYITSPEFLQAMSEMTGIPDLLPDPRMFGGGTHENRHNQDLAPHVDFNFEPGHGLHRRVNLILYLNKGWREEWGGAIELHSNPRDPGNNEISAFNCIFNRAVLFETNEISWHAFPKIVLPEDQRDNSRKSLSIYLYTKDRPAEEIAPPARYLLCPAAAFLPPDGGFAADGRADQRDPGRDIAPR